MNRQEIIDALYDNNQALKKGMAMHMQQAAIDAAISPAQLHLLMMIKQHQPITAKQLAAKLQMTPGAVSQLLDGVHNLNLVQRTPHPTDRRIYNLSLNYRGTQTLQVIECRRHEIMDPVMSSLTTAELQTWLRIQRKLIGAFQQPVQSNNKEANV